MQYDRKIKNQKSKIKNYIPLPAKNIDTGMGLERLAMVMQNKKNIFETDLYLPIISKIKNQKSKIKNKRIITDHIRGIVFLISDGVLPSNKEQGYILRRLIRRSIVHSKLLELPDELLKELAEIVIENYQEFYPELEQNRTKILEVISQEKQKFSKTLNNGLKELEKIIQSVLGSQLSVVSGRDVFHLYDTFGFPMELTKELAAEKGLRIDEKEFEKEFIRHQEISRVGAEKKFGGGGKLSPQLHTATHLLHAALRQVLGSHVQQMGSDITEERLRFDFSHPTKLTEKEIKTVEELVNQKIKENLVVKKEEMSYQEALNSGALAFFREKYPEKVLVYTIYNSKSGEIFSKEICAGPHVENTGQLGQFKIISEKSSSAGVRRIKAILIQ
jgi:alanyl-tRNA synthetase